MPIWSYICEEILKRVCQSHETEKSSLFGKRDGIFRKQSRRIALLSKNTNYKQKERDIHSNFA